MKKIYLQPETESLAINMVWSLCDGSGETVQQNNQQQNANDNFGFAPGRKVF